MLELVRVLENVSFLLLLARNLFGLLLADFRSLDLAQAMYHKIIPVIFSEFEWEFAEPEVERTTKTTFTVRYMNMMMRYKSREAEDKSVGRIAPR